LLKIIRRAKILILKIKISLGWDKISLSPFTQQYAQDRKLPLDVVKDYEREFKRFIFLVKISQLPLGLMPGPVLEYWMHLSKPRFGGLYKKYCIKVLKREFKFQSRQCDGVTHAWTWTAYNDTFGKPSYLWGAPDIQMMSIAGGLIDIYKKTDADVWDIRRVLYPVPSAKSL
jgi:hypothetical protein